MLLCLPLYVSYGQQQITALTPNTFGLSSGPSNFLTHGNQLLFVAHHESFGRELWRSDGTVNGTVLVKDINVGRSGGSYSNFLEFKGMVYFVANDGVNGYQLWTTDGSTSGTRQVSNNVYQAVEKLVTDGNYIYFLKKDGDYVLDLWKSDGTSSGTAIVKGDMPAWNAPSNLTIAGGFLFFSFQPFGTNNTRVWRSDGTADGTFPVTEELDGDGSHHSGTSHPTRFVEFNGSLYFIARGPFPYPETVGLMKSDGTIAGTTSVKALHPGNTRLINHGGVLVHNNKMYFSFFEADLNRFFIWESDGTEFNTKLIYDQSYPKYFSPSSILAKDDHFYFTTGNATDGTSLVKFNVESHATEVLKEISGPKSEPFIFGDWSVNSIIESNDGKLFIKSKFDDWSLPELWTSDGTSAGTIKLSNVKGVGDLASFGDKVYFNGSSDQSYELWSSTGTLSSTSLFMDINLGNSGLGYTQLVTNSTKSMFSGNDGIHGSEPWITDGTSQGTSMIKDLKPGPSGSFPLSLAEWNDNFIFTALTDVNQQLLFKSDGTPDGTAPSSNIVISQPFVRMVKSTDGKIMFFTNMNNDGSHSLYRMDENETSAIELKNFGKNVYNVGFSVREMVVAGSTLYMLIEAEGVDLWKSDGTKDGTVKVIDLYNASELTAVNNDVYFIVYDDYIQKEKEIYKSDGTAQGTILLKDLNGTESSEPSGLRAFGNKLIFTATDKSYGREIWISDGTSDGTKMLKDIFPGVQNGIFGKQLAILREQFFFTANDGSHGPELWKSDGSTENTSIVKDLLPGIEGSRPDQITSIDDKLYFSAYTPANGIELWSSDGTAENSRLLVDVIPGPEYSNPANFTRVNDLLVFSAKTPTDGIQLWSYGSSVTGIDEMSTSFSVFPNPSNGVFKINFNKEVLSNGFVEIFSADGRSVQKVNYSQGEAKVDLAHSPPGLYVIKVFDKSHCFTTKVIKF
jgi:trimeric autotransporter adhesin